MIRNLERRFQETNSEGMRQYFMDFMNDKPCPVCGGARLRPEALAVTVAEKGIHQVSEMAVTEALEWFDQLRSKNGADQQNLSERQLIIADRILKEITTRLQFMCDVGLDYLTLSRGATTLSGGEAQRVKLAKELLNLELNHWRETGSLIHPHILTLIHQRRETLRQLAKDEAELLFRSALAAGYGIAEWVEPAWVAGVPVAAISLEALQRDNFRIRVAAVAALGSLESLQEKDGQFVRSIIKMLVDDYPQVRRAAIRASISGGRSKPAFRPST